MLEGMKACLEKLIVLIIQLLVFFFFNLIPRVCVKENLIQKSYLLIAKRCYFIFKDLVPSIPYLISMDLLASWRICDGNTLTSPLLFSLAPVLYHEPWSHGGTWPRGTGWLRSSSSKPCSLSLGSHGFQQADSGHVLGSRGIPISMSLIGMCPYLFKYTCLSSWR